MKYIYFVRVDGEHINKPKMQLVTLSPLPCPIPFPYPTNLRISCQVGS